VRMGAATEGCFSLQRARPSAKIASFV